MKNLIVRHSGLSVILTTECKRQQTAINRFSKFLSDYDREHTEFMLKCFMSLAPVYNHDGVCGYKSKYWCKDCSYELLVHNDVYMFVLDFSETINDEEIPFFESGLNYSDSDTSDFDSEDTKDTVFLGSFDDVQTDISHIPLISFNSRFLPVPRWFYQRANIYIWSAVLSAFNAVRDIKDRRKRVIVKPVRVSPCSCFPAYRFISGYPYTAFVDGLEVWDCRSHFYNEYLCCLISAPSYDELPF